MRAQEPCPGRLLPVQVCACVRACVRVRVRACEVRVRARVRVRACVRMCMRVRACVKSLAQGLKPATSGVNSARDIAYMRPDRDKRQRTH
jgi:hypothetical protein